VSDTWQNRNPTNHKLTINLCRLTNYAMSSQHVKHQTVCAASKNEVAPAKQTLQTDESAQMYTKA